MPAPNSACTEARDFASTTRHGELVVRLKGPYDIAANRDPQSAHPKADALTTDWWDGHVVKEVGPNYGRLLQQRGVLHYTPPQRAR